MGNYEKISPEVIVGLGKNTLFQEKEPPFKTVTHLHLELEDWLGDDLMECYPIYAVTETLKKGLEQSEFTGFTFKEFELTKSEYFFDNYQLNKELPVFFWFIVDGKEDMDDFVLSSGKELFVKPEVLRFLQDYNIKFLDVDPEKDELDDLLDGMISESKD